MGIFSKKQNIEDYIQKTQKREAAMIRALFEAGYSTVEIAKIADLPAFVVGTRLNEAYGAEAKNVLLIREIGPKTFVIENQK